MTEKVTYMPSGSVPWCKPNIAGVGTLATTDNLVNYPSKLSEVLGTGQALVNYVNEYKGKLWYKGT